MKDKLILDACCGSRMFWFDKENPNCLFIDKRNETLEAKDSSQKSGLRIIDVKPDLIADFTDMPFENGSFAMVVFDPPHLKTLSQNSWMAKKYGRLPNDWEFMIAKGFDECMRVLQLKGTLIFKWNESEIKSKQVLDIIPYKPLFGHTTGRQAKTIWMAFMKIPQQSKNGDSVQQQLSVANATLPLATSDNCERYNAIKTAHNRKRWSKYTTR